MIRIIPGTIYQSSNEPDWYYKMAGNKMANGDFIDLHGKRIHPLGFPFVLSYLFKLGLPINKSVFYFNTLIGSLTSVIIFILTYVLFKRTPVALISSLIFSVMYKGIYYSRTGASEPIALFFITLTLTIFLISYRANKISMYLLALSLLAYCAEIKSESLVYLIIFLLGLLIFKGRVTKLIIPFALFLVLLFPVYTFYLNHLDLPLMIEKMLNPNFAEKNDMSSLRNNLYGFIKELEEFNLYEKVILFLFVLPFLQFIRYKKQIIFLISYLFINLLLYSSTLYSVAERYVVMLYPILAIMSGLGFFILININKNLKVYSKLAYPLFILLLLIGPVLAISQEKSYNDINEIIEMRKEGIFEDDAIIICCNWMEHCGSLFPEEITIKLEEFVQRPFFSGNKKKYYIESANENMVGCRKEIKKQLFNNFETILIKDNIITKVYEIR